MVRDKRGRWEPRHKPSSPPPPGEQYCCEPCNFRTDNPWKLNRHHSTRKHLLCTGGRESSRPFLSDSPGESEGGEIGTALQTALQSAGASDNCSLAEGGNRQDSPFRANISVTLAPSRHRKRSATVAMLGCERRENSTRKSAISAHEKVRTANKQVGI